MRLVVDANVVFAALLKDGATRHLLLQGKLDLHAPEWIWREVRRNRSQIERRSAATPEAMDMLEVLLQGVIQAVPQEVTLRFLDKALARLHPEDAADAPYLATAMAMKASLWSHDKRLSGKAGVDVVTTKDLLARDET